MHNRLKPIFYFILVFLFNTQNGSAQNGSTLRSLEINSKIIGEPIQFSVYLPQSYSTTQDSFPVLYLLHGFGGDENSWLNRCAVDKTVDSLCDLNLIPELILIMPDGRYSYFINNYDSSFRYEDFFIRELVPHIDSVFRIKKEKKAHAIVGLSMGGYGAVLLTVKHPDLFNTCITLSGAIRNKEIFMHLTQDRYEKYFAPVYGPGLSDSARITAHWLANSPYELINKDSRAIYDSLNWYIDCGMQDFLFPANKEFHEHMLRLNIPHEYHMRIGKHNWEYWKTGFINGVLYWFQ